MTGSPKLRHRFLLNLHQRLIGAAAAIALEVKGDVCVADLPKRFSDLGRSPVLQELAHLGGADLDARQVEDN